MAKFKEKYRIESTRLKDFDYSNAGAYFITICTKNKSHLFGKIIDNEMILNEYGNVVSECWHDLSKHFKNLKIDEFIIMPNHIHLIIILKDVEKGNSLSDIVRSLRSYSTRKINQMRNSKEPEIWQSRFYDRVIRNEDELNRIREYIIYNPLNWSEDEYFSE